jgi:acid phosphatase (class A)
MPYTRRFIRNLVLGFALAAIALPVTAETPANYPLSAIPATPPAISGAPQAPVYLDVKTLPPTLLPAPPAKDSAAWKREMNSILAAQKNISKDEQATIVREQALHPELIAAFVSARLTRADYPKTFALLDNVFGDTFAVVQADKTYWHVTRPYLLNPGIKVLVHRLDDNPAYPSGHEAEALVMAEVLGMLYPDKREALLAYAESIGWHRVEAGVHYPGDLEGGRMLAMLIVGALTQDDNFADDLAEAQIEIDQKK